MSEFVAFGRIVSRRNGEATVWIDPHPRFNLPVQRVTVEDNEPEDVFGPIFQRAAEAVGLDFQVDYSASRWFESHPIGEVVDIVRAE